MQSSASKARKLHSLLLRIAAHAGGALGSLQRLQEAGQGVVARHAGRQRNGCLQQQPSLGGALTMHAAVAALTASWRTLRACLLCGFLDSSRSAFSTGITTNACLLKHSNKHAVTAAASTVQRRKRG